jgi:hypothetical protein
MVPFRGIPETNMRDPLDLIYLDEDCRVIEVVESFPTFRVTPSSPQAASVLALPTHSIYSSQTQQGDQLVLCVAEEMQRRLERFSSSSGIVGTVQNAAILRAKPLWSGGPGVAEMGNRSGGGNSESDQFYEMDLVEPGMNDVKPSEELAGALVVSRSEEGAGFEKGSTGDDARCCSVLLDRRRSQGPCGKGYQLDRIVRGDGGTLVSGHPDSDDTSSGSLRRRSGRAFDSGALKGCPLGQRRRWPSVHPSRCSGCKQGGEPSGSWRGQG